MEYRVLARKYRPATFSDLIGQEVLVRTLSNAIASGRVAHAFLLTGIRGVGKTTTARIIARALNCEKGPTVSPCGECANCRMIAEDRHPDVMEMDAASRTGVNDIRDLIDTVHYAPGSARYKIYIIDEVHMLSTSAFNALLKTLEEPPPHVKFIFATTESRKIPVTILSRCQRFDLKRITLETLSAHLSGIAQKEGVQLQPEASALLAQAAEGSVRDGLSLLDQAIAHAPSGQPVDEALVRGMLGMADRAQTINLLESLLKGEAAGALERLKTLYENGADPLLVLQDLLEFTHFITRIKLVPAVAEDISYAEHERKRAAALAQQLSMPVLARLWQMLLKGVAETRYAPSPAAALEMLIVRVAYASALPAPAEIIQELKASGAAASVPTEKKTQPPSVAAAAPPPPPVQEPVAAPTRGVNSFAELVATVAENKEPLLASQLRQFASLVSFAPGKVEIFVRTAVARDFTTKVAQVLQRATGMEWKISMASAPGEPTLDEQERARREQQIAQANEQPLVAKLREQFPGAEVVAVVGG